MLQGGFMSVLQSRTHDEFRDEVVRFANELGFEKVAAMVVAERLGADPVVAAVDNAPVGFLHISTDAAKSRADPVMQYIKRHSVPIVWDQQTYEGASMAPLWEEQAAFGYVTGIALALHMPEGKHFAFGVVRDRALPKAAAEVTRLVADLQLFAVCAQEAATKVLLPEGVQPERPGLTPRELECLRWTMEGKTAWEVGTILGISERTAVLHVNNAMHKLGCVSKHQAVVKALRLGLIH